MMQLLPAKKFNEKFPERAFQRSDGRLQNEGWVTYNEKSCGIFNDIEEAKKSLKFHSHPEFINHITDENKNESPDNHEEISY